MTRILSRATATVCVLCAVLLSQTPAEPAATASGKRNIAIITLKNTSGITAGESELITDRLSVELFSTGKVNVMERNQMQDILKEQGFQRSGTCSDEACLVEMGQLLGVNALVSGSIGKLGTLYMVNLRVIDVNTARITHVVSQDIKGGIEDVAGRLRDIAWQLVAEPNAAVPVAQVKQEPKPMEQPRPVLVEQVKQEPKPEEPPAEVVPPPQEAPPPKATDRRTERNKNRSGLRLQFGTYPADMTQYWRSKSGGRWQEQKGRYDADSYDSLSKLGYDTRFRTNLYRWEVLFVVPLGKVLEFDVGPGVAYYHEERYFSSTSATDWRDWDLRIVSPNITLGFGLVKRFYPLKINVGLLLDLNFNITRFSNDWDLLSSGSGTFNGSDFRVNGSFGPRVGLELLGRPHFGVNVDFQYRYSRITTDVYDSDIYDYRYLLPGVGLNMGVNFYF